MSSVPRSVQRIALACAILLILLVDTGTLRTRLDDPAQPRAQSPVARPEPSATKAPPINRILLARIEPSTGKPRRVFTIAPNGSSARSISVFPLPARRGDHRRFVYSRVIESDSGQYFGCGIAGCTQTTYSSIQAGIAVSALNGTRGRLLTKGGYDIEPVVSPDGTRIAYLQNLERSNDKQAKAVTLLDWSGKELRLIVPPAGTTYESVTWSPDGSKLAVLREPIGGAPSGARVIVMNTVGRRKRIVARGPFRELAWSHDGRFLAGTRFKHNGSDANDIIGIVFGSEVWVIPLDGSRPRNVSKLAGDTQVTGAGCGSAGGATPRVYQPVWSPDDRHIAFLSSYGHAERLAGDVFDVMTVGVDGRSRRTILRSPEPPCSSDGYVRQPAKTTLVLAGWI